VDERWLAAHHRYCARQASREGFEFDDEILIVLERFEVYGRSIVGLLKHQLINPRALCASSGFISRICSSL
jgi:hypothetical protein